MQVGPCIPVGKQLEKAEVGPTSGPTCRLCHLVADLPVHVGDGDDLGPRGEGVSESQRLATIVVSRCAQLCTAYCTVVYS